MRVLSDFQVSVRKALTEIDPNWEHYNGLIICGSHAPHDTEEMIEAIKEAREKKIPALLICLGYQLAAIEYARNVVGISQAASEEFGKGYFVVKKRKEGLNVGLKEDGESYWNNYEVDPELEKRWEKPNHFFLTQAHPEYQSSPWNPHPLLVSFLEKCKEACRAVGS